MSVENLYRHWIYITVENDMVIRDGMRHVVVSSMGVFYADDGIIGSWDSEWLQGGLNILIILLGCTPPPVHYSFCSFSQVSALGRVPSRAISNHGLITRERRAHDRTTTDQENDYCVHTFAGIVLKLNSETEIPICNDVTFILDF